MTRLRLAQSSPERMAELMRELTDRGRRLMLRWYAHGSACAVLAEEDKHAWGLAGHDDPAYRYRQEWCTKYIYQLWPADGDERLRRELDE